ncbi:MAG: phosphoribosyltransferase family protein [Arhodomonas sp.]|nr:phosphoribosyltransferase family protein [Arhodomonas sp.]
MAGEDHIRAEAERQLDTLRERRRRYTPVRPPIDPEGRVVVVVDDGSATGATMAAALRTLRNRGPEELVAAMGVAPPETAEHLKGLADRVVCVATPGTSWQ